MNLIVLYLIIGIGNAKIFSLGNQINLLCGVWASLLMFFCCLLFSVAFSSFAT
jgi:hypothetical protein